MKKIIVTIILVVFNYYLYAQTITKEEIECIDALILAKTPGSNYKAEIDYRTLIMACDDTSFIFNKKLINYYLDSIKTNDSIRNHFYGMLNYYYSGYKDVLATKLVVYELVKNKYKQVNNESSLLKFVDLICLSTYNHNDYIKSTIDTNYIYLIDSIFAFKNTVYNAADKSIHYDRNATYLGGDKALLDYIRNSIIYPTYERSRNIRGRVQVRFLVEKDGRVSDVVVMEKVSPGLDCEAMRVVKLMPRWIPATSDGKPVRLYFMIPINFN